MAQVVQAKAQYFGIAERVFMIAASCGVGLVVLHALAMLSGRNNIRRFFDLDAEQSIGTWFSSMQLALVALVALTIVLPAKGVPPALRWQLPLIAAVFFFLSVDEATGIHEHMTRLSRTRQWIPTMNGQHAWILPYLGFAAIMALLVRKSAIWLLSRDAMAFWATLAGMAAFLSGAAGIEMINQRMEHSLVKQIAIAAEEWLEMLGVSLCLYAMLRIKRLTENMRQTC